MYVWTPPVQSCVPLVAIGLLAACAAPPTVSMDVPLNPVFEPTSLGTSTPVPSVPLSTPTPSYVVVTSPDQVLGTWHLHAEGLRFDSDGTFRMATRVGGLESNPFAIGSYAFDGDRVLLTDIRIQAKHAERLRVILGRLSAAAAPRDMCLPGLDLHELRGPRKGTWAVTVSGNWRVTFVFVGPDVAHVDYEDYH